MYLKKAPSNLKFINIKIIIGGTLNLYLVFPRKNLGHEEKREFYQPTMGWKIQIRY